MREIYHRIWDANINNKVICDLTGHERQAKTNFMYNQRTFSQMDFKKMIKKLYLGHIQNYK